MPNTNEQKKPFEPQKSAIKEGEKKPEKKDDLKEKSPTSGDVKKQKQERFASSKKTLEQRRAEFSEKSKADKGVKKELDRADPKDEKKDKKTEKPNWNLRDAERAAEQAEKEALQALKEKHAAEIHDVLQNIDIDGLDTQNRGAIHVASIAGRIPKEKVDSLPKETKENALKGLTGPDGRDIDVSKPLTPEQTEVVRLHLASEYISALSNFSAADIKDPKKLAEIEKKYPGVTDFVKSQPVELLSQKTFFESAKKDPKILENFSRLIQENGMLMTGITPTSKLGKELVRVIATNVSEYEAINKSAEWLIDIEHFKGLKDVLGGAYMDLICSRDFILGEKHDLKKSRDAMMNLFRDSLAARKIPDPKTATPEEMAEYRKGIKEEFQNATGVSGEKVETAIKHIDKSKLSPLMRFLADIFAPFGALFPGKAGDFWREYLKNSENDQKNENSTNNPNYEQYGAWSGWIEWLEPGSILAAANKYVGVNEAKNGDLIREMHKSGWLNAGPGTPWCMSFVQHVLRKDMHMTSEQIGVWPTASAAAGHRIGRHTDTPQLGDIILVKSSAAPSGNHIAFFAWFEGNRVKLLGWNQNDSVCLTTYPKSAVDEYRTLQKAPNTNVGNNSMGWEKAVSGNDAFPDTPIGPNNYPSRDFLAKNGKTPETVPMGMRVNNPLNIKFTGSQVQRNLFEGVVGKSVHTDQGDPQIAFSTPEAGMVSGLRLLLYKQKTHGLNTIQSLIADPSLGWIQGGGAANPLGNNAAREIAQRAGMSLTEPLNLSDKGTMRKFVQSLLFQEHGPSSSIYGSVLDASIAKI